MKKLIYVQHTRLLLDVAKRFPLIQSVCKKSSYKSKPRFFKDVYSLMVLQGTSYPTSENSQFVLRIFLSGIFLLRCFLLTLLMKYIKWKPRGFLRCLQLDGLTEHELSNFWKSSVCAANLSEIFLLVCFLLTLLMNRNTLLHWIF